MKARNLPQHSERNDLRCYGSAIGFGRMILPCIIMPFLRSVMLWLCCGWFTTLTAAGATLHVWPDSPAPAAPYTNWTTAAHTIQDAVDAAQVGDTVLVTNGVYATGGRAVNDPTPNRVAIDKAITVQSVNGPEVTIVEGPGRCAYLITNAVLNGFTLTNGTADYGGGAWCSSFAVITNCVLSGNSASGGGGGVYGGSAVRGVYGGALYNCILTNNQAAYFGGGASACRLYDCTIADNSAWKTDGDGGGVENCILERCTLARNYAGEEGGGAQDSTLDNCTLFGNSSYDGGGTDQCALNRCTLIGNTANPNGGSGAGARYRYSPAVPPRR